METKGKVLAIDLGEKRIGLAISDETRTIAAGYDVMTRRSRQEDFERYADIVEKEAIDPDRDGLAHYLDRRGGTARGLGARLSAPN